MDIRVSKDIIKIDMDSDIHKGEYKINTCEFTFTEDYTNDLVKVAVFTRADKTTYRVVIQNDECDIPYEVLNSKGAIVIGVYAYSEDDGELVLRYSPRPVLVAVQDGSYIENTEESSIYVPASTIEEYEQQLQDLFADIEASKDEIIEEVSAEASVVLNDYMDQFVKVNISGKTINLQDSSNLPIKDIKIKVNSNETVTGNVEVYAANKNLADYTDLARGYFTNANGQPNTSTQGMHSNTLIKVPTDKKIYYRIKAKKDIQIGRFFFLWFDENQQAGIQRNSAVYDTNLTTGQVRDYVYDVTPFETQFNKNIEYFKWSIYMIRELVDGTYVEKNVLNDFQDLIEITISYRQNEDYVEHQAQSITLPLGDTQLAETDTIHKDNGTWKINDTAIEDTVLVTALNTLSGFYTYKNITNFFSVTSGANPLIDVTYIQDLETRLNNIEARLSLLE